MVSKLCEMKPGASACKKQGAAVAEQAVMSAKRALAGTQASARLAIVELAAAALVECGDPASAHSLIHNMVGSGQEILALGSDLRSVCGCGEP